MRISDADRWFIRGIGLVLQNHKQNTFSVKDVAWEIPRDMRMHYNNQTITRILKNDEYVEVDRSTHMRRYRVDFNKPCRAKEAAAEEAEEEYLDE